jgi:hypothetical protein
MATAGKDYGTLPDQIAPVMIERALAFPNWPKHDRYA